MTGPAVSMTQRVMLAAASRRDKGQRIVTESSKREFRQDLVVACFQIFFATFHVPRRI